MSPRRLRPRDGKVTSTEVVEALAGVDGVLDSADGVTVAADADSVAKAEVAGSTIDIPRDASDGVSLSHEESGEITIDLPGAESSANGTVVADGTVAYPSSGGFANAVQANSDGSVRMLTIINDSAAPTSFDYGVTPPEGGKISIAEEGDSAVVLNDKNEAVAVVDAPWTEDADGRTVETWFTTDGLTLTQHVAHSTDETAYPVTADPHFRWYWNGVVITLTPADMLTVAYGGTEALSDMLAVPDYGWASYAGVLGAASWSLWAYNNRQCFWSWVSPAPWDPPNMGTYKCR